MQDFNAKKFYFQSILTAYDSKQCGTKGGAPAAFVAAKALLYIKQNILFIEILHKQIN